MIWYSDPGHAWLRVKQSELETLGLTDRISKYSYRNGSWAYLEEDSDALLYLSFKEVSYEDMKAIPLKNCNGQSKIRLYPNYWV